jgi:hypothetical protein
MIELIIFRGQYRVYDGSAMQHEMNAFVELQH